nr:hypothetical protein [Tanacetum cinerariifolium]
MIDRWTYEKQISIINVYVNFREGTTFLSSAECSTKSHSGKFIHDYVNKGIEDVVPHNVIQVVTNNVVNNMVAAQLLEQEGVRYEWFLIAALADYNSRLLSLECSSMWQQRFTTNKTLAFRVYSGCFAFEQKVAVSNMNSRVLMILEAVKGWLSLGFTNLTKVLGGFGDATSSEVEESLF